MKIDHDQNTWHPASAVDQFNWRRFDAVWNEDETQFRAVPLLWWDDASYIAYQYGCGDEGPDDYEITPEMQAGADAWMAQVGRDAQARLDERADADTAELPF